VCAFEGPTKGQSFTTADLVGRAFIPKWSATPNQVSIQSIHLMLLISSIDRNAK